MIYSAFKKILFKTDPEQAHNLAIKSLRTLQKLPPAIKLIHNKLSTQTPALRSRLWGIDFTNPIGLAAGFDKNASVYPALSALGFGFVEVGTITPNPQPGNPIPRLFRLPEDQAIINRMGFNNCGALAARQNIIKLKQNYTVLGINIGKNKDTPNEEAYKEYIHSLRMLYEYGDYFVINISSPNTAKLRQLQQKESLAKLLKSIMTERDILAEVDRFRPLLLKIAPDISEQEIRELATVALSTGIDGIIATNTTVNRFNSISKHKEQTGGLSGRPLTLQSNSCIREIYKVTNGKLPIIGVGGVFTGQDAYDKIRSGANLVQVYTGMIYRGPAIAKKVNLELNELMQRDSVQSLTEVIGADIM